MRCTTQNWSLVCAYNERAGIRLIQLLNTKKDMLIAYLCISGVPMLDNVSSTHIRLSFIRTASCVLSISLSIFAEAYSLLTFRPIKKHSRTQSCAPSVLNYYTRNSAAERKDKKVEVSLVKKTKFTFNTNRIFCFQNCVFFLSRKNDDSVELNRDS